MSEPEHSGDPTPDAPTERAAAATGADTARDTPGAPPSAPQPEPRPQQGDPGAGKADPDAPEADPGASEAVPGPPKAASDTQEAAPEAPKAAQGAPKPAGKDAPAADGGGVGERVTDVLYGLGWGTVKRLPEPVAAGLGRTIADTVWRRRGKGVLRLEGNLARVVPDAGPRRLTELSRAGMRSYMRYWMESFRLPAWREDRVRTGFDPAGLHHLTDGLESGRGVILALPHLANWDLAGAWVTTRLGVPFTTVMERLKPESLYDRFVAYRAGLGMEVLPHTGGTAFGILARRLRDGGLVCLVADRDLSASGVGVTFFGEEARMPAGPALLAQRTGALLLPVTLWYDDSPVMQGRVHPPIEVPRTGDRAEKTSVMTQALADAFATGIADHPEDWHMLQRLWLADLDPARRPAPPEAGGTT